jgi:ankyrin repeat domain-containing protein 50
MDPASGAAGLASLGIQLCQSLLAFYGSFKDARADVRRVHNSIERLDGGLNQIAKCLTTQNPAVDNDITTEVHKNLSVVQEGLTELERKLQKIRLTPNPDGGVWDDIKDAGRRAKYPFRESTITKLNGIVDDSLTHLSLVLNALQLYVIYKSLYHSLMISAAMSASLQLKSSLMLAWCSRNSTWVRIKFR